MIAVSESERRGQGMVWSIAGVVLWSVAHLWPAVAPGARRGLVSAMGEVPYRGVFALLIAASVGLMVLGWRAAGPGDEPPPLGAGPAPRVAVYVLVFAGLFLFAAAFLGSNLRRVVRHPQLAGFLLWAVAHLLANGDARSLVTFGGLGLWAAVEMLALNRRDGAQAPPEPLPATRELRPLAAAAAVFAVLFFAHPWVSGVALTAGG